MVASQSKICQFTWFFDIFFFQVESIKNVPEEIKTAEKDSIPVFFFGSKD